MRYSRSKKKQWLFRNSYFRMMVCSSSGTKKQAKGVNRRFTLSVPDPSGFNLVPRQQKLS